MKRVLLSCFLLMATCTVTINRAAAQTTVSVTTFNAKVNQMDSQLGAGDLTGAQTTWQEIHTMMIAELAVTKQNIAAAPTTAAHDAAMANLVNQTTIYRTTWALKTDLAANRAAIHTSLGNFAATF